MLETAAARIQAKRAVPTSRAAIRMRANSKAQARAAKWVRAHHPEVWVELRTVALAEEEARISQTHGASVLADN